MTVENKVEDQTIDQPNDSKVDDKITTKDDSNLSDKEWRETRLNEEIQKKKDALDKYSDIEAKLKVFTDNQSKDERKKLIEKDKFDEAYKSLQTEFDDFKNKSVQDSFNLEKKSILNEYKISDEQSKFITGTTLEELKANAEEFSRAIWDTKQKEDEATKKKDLDGNIKIDTSKGSSDNSDLTQFLKDMRN